MRIGIGGDHSSIEHKKIICEHLNKLNYNVHDYGTSTNESCDYPDYAKLVCQDIIDNKIDIGILICSTGIGISIAANKFNGIYCALVHNEHTAKMAKEHNNANILALGSKIIDTKTAILLIDIWLKTDFDKRHLTRINKII